ncbi:MAG: hypothetical protein EAZ55_11615 [Cytophagales bacterium]|nr:MAG: hypothetical protein EAZ55_11615 [Cytophagales bacterium]
MRLKQFQKRKKALKKQLESYEEQLQKPSKALKVALVVGAGIVLSWVWWQNKQTKNTEKEQKTNKKEKKNSPMQKFITQIALSLMKEVTENLLNQYNSPEEEDDNTRRNTKKKR